MARGTTLTALVSMLRHETGASAEPSKGISAKASLEESINAEYLRLYEDYDWPFLNTYDTINTQAGSRYYNVPATISAERITSLSVKYQSKWQPIVRGISVNDYNQYDPETDSRSDPVRKWDVYNENQIEIWPLPVTNNLAIRVEGIKTISKLISGSDVCLLDDKLVVFYAAAEILRSKRKSEADEKLLKANKHYKTIKARIHGVRSFSLNGQQNSSATRTRNVTWVGNI